MRTVSASAADFPATGSAHLRPYDQVMVPALFHPWGCLLVGALRPRPGMAALDVGTGPGTVARILAAMIGPGGHVVGVDASPAMLHIASTKPEVSGAALTYIESNAAPLSVPDAAFDIVACQQALQFFPDRLAALLEMRRAIRSGGRLGLLTWAGLDRNPMFRALRDVVEDVLSPRHAGLFSEPWCLDAAEIIGLVEAAGFTAIEAQHVTLPVTIPGGITALRQFFDFCAISADIAALPPERQDQLTAIVQANLAPLTSNGTVQSIVVASLVLATAPS